MIVIRSDYSPQAAPEEQELDNIMALDVALLIAGLRLPLLNAYKSLCTEAAEGFTAAVEESPGDWKAATDAVEDALDQASELLADNGITIDNILCEPEVDGYFAHIETTVYKNGPDMKPAAKIERPILDHEKEHYKNNKTGWGARNVTH